MTELLLMILIVLVASGLLLYAKINIKNKIVNHIYNFIFSKSFLSFLFFFLISWIPFYNLNIYYFLYKNFILAYLIILLILFCLSFKYDDVLEIPLLGIFMLLENLNSFFSFSLFILISIIVNTLYIYISKTKYKKINNIFSISLFLFFLVLIFIRNLNL